jgi:hypothetical protein
MEKHVAVILSPAEQADLGSITKHPGMHILVEKVMKGHVDQRLHQIYDVPLDDRDRITKLAAISASAVAMGDFLDFVRKELYENWKVLEQREAKAAQEMKK